MRLCVDCNTEKDESEFNPARTKDGLQRCCKKCSVIRTRKYQDKKRDACKVSVLVQSAKYRAKKNGVKFSITEADIEQPKRCPIFGMILIYGVTGLGYSERENAASLDRIYPDKGYVPGNVVVISYKANRAKSMLTPKELKKMADFYMSLDKYATNSNNV